jgi:AbrB family looped-hinge helix DNA binding protein
VDVVKVTSKGQVTLPAKVRRSLGITDQSYLVAEQVGDFLVLRKLEARLDELTDRFEREARTRGITRAALLRALRATRRRGGRS